jgi:hypothetical protein
MGWREIGLAEFKSADLRAQTEVCATRTIRPRRNVGVVGLAKSGRRAAALHIGWQTCTTLVRVRVIKCDGLG